MALYLLAVLVLIKTTTIESIGEVGLAKAQFCPSPPAGDCTINGPKSPKDEYRVSNLEKLIWASSFMIKKDLRIFFEFY